jgi:hypothetical protein
MSLEVRIRGSRFRLFPVPGPAASIGGTFWLDYSGPLWAYRSIGLFGIVGGIVIIARAVS